MNRVGARIWPIALAALLALGGLLALTVARGPLEATPAEQAAALAAELRCPDCQGLSVADSPTRAATEIRRQIADLLAAGRSPDEVRQHFVDRYGEWILLSPPRLLLLLIPALALLLGAIALVAWLRPGRGRSAAETAAVPAGAAPSERELRRIRDEAGRLDA
jgi:cytochrome c-type biogenesis protein CcmH